MGDEGEDLYEDDEPEFYEDDDDDEDEDDDEEDEDEEGVDLDDEALLDNEDEEFNLQIIKKLKVNDNNHRYIKIVPHDKYISSHIIQYTELVEAIGQRISQIEANAPVFTDVTGYTSSIDMAKKEFIDRRSPLTLTRKRKELDNGDFEVEIWKVREMTFPVSNKEILDITEKMIESMNLMKLK